YFIGCSGWFYWHWRGLFYAAQSQPREWFKEYCKHFNTVEINASFYHFPTEKTAKGWLKRAPKEFIYTVKANKAITHIKKFKGTRRLIKNFYKVVNVLKENNQLGCVLFQLPPSLHYSKTKLKEILQQLNPEFKNVIEFRHASWWNKEVYDEMKKHDAIFCIVSATEKIPADYVYTSKKAAYFRFHGREWYRYSYSEEELKQYAEEMKKCKAKEVYAYFNNDFNAFAPRNAIRLKQLLGLP
ncbi:MAG: DUF72 domain-containing protein, partial [Candidatus Iainarchaeum archaeon]